VPTIRSFPSAIYNTKTIITAVKGRLLRLGHELPSSALPLTPAVLAQAKRKQEETSLHLLEALSILYIKTGDYTEAVRVYLRLGRSDVFDLVRDLKLFDTVRDQVLLLMKFDLTQAVELYTDNVESVSIDEVAGQLSEDPRLLHHYLHALFVKDPMLGFKYHEKQVALYAEHQPSALLAFLKSSNCYLLEDALAICEAKELYQEMVFLLRKMGDLNYALTLLVDKLHDFKVFLPTLRILTTLPTPSLSVISCCSPTFRSYPPRDHHKLHDFFVNCENYQYRKDLSDSPINSHAVTSH
jgi:hypothetical protein